MAYEIEYVDEIARKFKRDVAWVEFDFEVSPETLESIDDLPHRKFVIELIEKLGLGWTSCFGWFDGGTEEIYLGAIYVDIEVDFQSEKFLILKRLLERDDEIPTIQGVRFICGRYTDALENQVFYRKVINSI